MLKCTRIATDLLRCTTQRPLTCVHKRPVDPQNSAVEATGSRRNCVAPERDNDDGASESAAGVSRFAFDIARGARLRRSDRRGHARRLLGDQAGHSTPNCAAYHAMDLPRVLFTDFANGALIMKRCDLLTSVGGSAIDQDACELVVAGPRCL
jgi:hypothetical protein